MKNIEIQIAETLNSIDDIQKAEAPYFFNTRVQAKLNQRLASIETPWLPKWKPIWAITTLTILLSINIFSVTQKYKSKKTNSTNNTETANLEGFSNTYNLNSALPY